MSAVYKMKFKFLLFSVQFLILQTLMVQNSVAHDKNATEKSHPHPKEHNIISDKTEWNQSNFALPLKNKKQYNTLLYNKTKLTFVCEISRVNKKESKALISFDDSPTAVSTFKGSKKRHYLPLMAIADQFKQLLLIGQLDSMNESRCTDFYTFPIPSKKQNKKRKLYIISEMLKNNKEHKFSDNIFSPEEHILSEYTPPSAIGFSYNISEQDSTCPLYIQLNPWQLFNQLSGSSALDISSLPILQIHPYLQNFYVSIARYDNNTIYIDVKPKLIDPHANAITTTESQNVLIPKSGKRLMIFCASISQEEQITIEFKNADPLSIEKPKPITCDKCPSIPCSYTKKSNDKKIQPHPSYLDVTKTGIKNLFSYLKPSYCATNIKKDDEKTQELSTISDDYGIMKTAINKVSVAVNIASMYLPNIELPPKIINPIKIISSGLSAFKVAYMIADKPSKNQPEAQQADQSQSTANTDATHPEKNGYKNAYNQEKTPVFTEAIKVNKQRATYGLQANSNAQPTEWKMFGRKNNQKKAPKLIEQLKTDKFTFARTVRPDRNGYENDNSDHLKHKAENIEATSINRHSHWLAKSVIAFGKTVIMPFYDNGFDGFDWKPTLSNTTIALGSIYLPLLDQAYFLKKVGILGIMLNLLTSTESTPITKVIDIDNVDTLQIIGNHTGLPSNGNYRLTANIDASNFTQPIKEFTGTLDGQEHTISNLQCCLIQNLEGDAIVKNIIIRHAHTKGSYCSATITSMLKNNAIINSIQVKDSQIEIVRGSHHAGIIAEIMTDSAMIKNTLIYNCSLSSTDSAANSGGVAGIIMDYAKSRNNTISHCDITTTGQSSGAGGVTGLAIDHGISDNDSVIQTNITTYGHNAYAGLEAGRASNHFQVKRAMLSDSTVKTYGQFSDTAIAVGTTKYGPGVKITDTEATRCHAIAEGKGAFVGIWTGSWHQSPEISNSRAINCTLYPEQAVMQSTIAEPVTVDNATLIPVLFYGGGTLFGIVTIGLVGCSIYDGYKQGKGGWDLIKYPGQSFAKWLTNLYQSCSTRSMMPKEAKMEEGALQTKDDEEILLHQMLMNEDTVASEEHELFSNSSQL